MQKWLPWEIVSNHLGQEMKHHKSVLYDDFIHLSIENMNEVLKVRKNVNFQNFKIYVALQNGCNGDFAPILEFRTYNAKCGKTRVLFKMIYLH